MKAVNVTTSATVIVAPGPVSFITLYNNSDTTIYLKFDGDSDTVTTALGFPLVAGATLILVNDTLKAVFTHGITGIHGGSGNKEVRVQGAE